MNFKKNRKNQADKNFSYCLIFLFSIICFGICVFYVKAEEIDANNGKEEETVWEAAFWTSYDWMEMAERERFYMANQDAIEVMQTETKGHSLSEKEYRILTRIVEAEAGNMDKKSKILVANVILNRMAHKEFPDTVEEVVFQNVNGAIQFSPVADGRYYTVNVTDSTKESVDRALDGEDYSKGALYFMERSMSAASNVNWFDTCLTRLFKYESHEFYK